MFICFVGLVLNIINAPKICITCSEVFNYSLLKKILKYSVICKKCRKIEQKRIKKEKILAYQEERTERANEENFKFIHPRSKQILEESVAIINKTKNVETAITRFDTIKKVLSDLLEIVPKSRYFSFTIGDVIFKKMEDIEKLENVKIQWLKEFFKNKTEIEIKKAEMINSPKLKVTQYKKALNQALKAFDYIPEDEYFKEIVIWLDLQIVDCTSIDKEKKLSVKEWENVFKKAIKDGKITREEFIELEKLEKTLNLNSADLEKYWEKTKILQIEIQES